MYVPQLKEEEAPQGRGAWNLQNILILLSFFILLPPCDYFIYFLPLEQSLIGTSS